MSGTHDEPLRIAAHNGAPVFGGAEIALCRLLRGLEARGHEIVLYYNREVVGVPARETFGLDARPLHLGGDVALHHGVRFARELRRRSPHAVVVGTFRKLLPAVLGSRLAGVPRVAARVGLSTDTPRNLKYRLLVTRWIDRVVVNAPEIRRAYLETLPGLPADRVVTVATGVEAPPRNRPAGALRRELGIAPDVPVIGTLARLARQKRVGRLLRMTARLPAVRCLVAGEGPRRDDLEALARRCGVERRVRFLGHRDDVGDVLDALDLFVLTSEREGLSNAMLEAMASGVPVVSTRVSGATAALRPLEDGRRPGRIVDDGHGLIDALAGAVADLLDRPDERRRMGRAARLRVRRSYSPERMISGWEAVLRGEVPDPGPDAGSVPA